MSVLRREKLENEVKSDPLDHLESKETLDPKDLLEETDRTDHQVQWDPLDLEECPEKLANQVW